MAAAGAATNDQAVTETAELYDPATGTWAPTSPMGTRRALHIASQLADGRVLVAGGRTCNLPVPATCNFTFRTNSAEIYDPATNTWTPTGSMNLQRHTTNAARLHDGRVVVAGGFGTPGGVDTSEDTETFSTTNYTVLPSGKALIAGGLYVPPGTSLNTRSAEVYDPDTETWSSAGEMTTDHGTIAAQANANEAVVLSASATSFVFDPRVCGTNCGKVLVVGDNLTNGTADLYTPAPVSLENCTSTVSGQVTGDVNVPAAAVTCITNAQISGLVIVAPGGAVVINYSHIRGSLRIDGAAGVRMCGSNVGGATTITRSFGPVVIGGAGTGDGPRCATNQFTGPVTLDANEFVGLANNQFRGHLTVTWSAGLSQDQGNHVRGNLSCANNTPAASNGGRRNQVSGSRSGQCSAGGF